MTDAPTCAWCGQPAAPGLRDEDGDPACPACARGAEPLPSPPPSTHARLLTDDVLLRAVGLDAQVLAHVSAVSREARIEEASAGWLLARGWTTVTTFRGRRRITLGWRHFGRPGGLYPIGWRLAVSRELAAPSPQQRAGCA